MKANELRIGNIITNPHTGDVLTVRGIKPQYKRNRNYSTGEYFYFLDCDKYDGTDVTVDLFKGIELTQAWLLKFGFVEKPDHWHHNYYFNFCLHKSEVGLVFKYGGSVMNKVISSVHELQNAFALTGEELTINK